MEKIDLNKINAGTIEQFDAHGMTIGMRNGTQESLELLAEKINEIIETLTSTSMN